ncbi:MAG: type II toxin-antitoxin system VapC family toxin [Acidobacteriota bacterium]
MSAILTDTHALLWYLLEPSKLSAPAHTAMHAADTSATIYIPSIVLVELRYLVEKGTITEAVFDFVAKSISDPTTSLSTIPLDFESAQAVGFISRSIVPDMPDRIIAATALYMGLPLVTRDHKIQAATVITTIW